MTLTENLNVNIKTRNPPTPMKQFLLILVGIILLLNAAVAYAGRNYHSAIGWIGFLVVYIWLVVEMKKEKIIISFEFENEKK